VVGPIAAAWLPRLVLASLSGSAIPAPGAASAAGNGSPCQGGVQLQAAAQALLDHRAGDGKAEAGAAVGASGGGERIELALAQRDIHAA
jgi:hypothetical protein